MDKEERKSRIHKKNHRRTYLVPGLPDPADPLYQAAAGGDVRGAIAGGFAHLLRIIAQMPPASCSLEFMFYYSPAGKHQNSQERLKLYVQLEASDSATACNLDKLLKGSPVSRFYDLQEVEEIPNAKQLDAGCQIIRRMDYLKPLCSCDLNPKIPRSYCIISLFTANEDNDYLMLDRVLDRIDEPVTISIRVEPADISSSLYAHAAYMARLADTNRWDTDYEEPGGIDFTGPRDHPYPRSQNSVRLLNYKDYLAGDVLNAERQIHKTLTKPHLSFSIEVKAETKSMSLLVASTVAEAAFKGGSYRITDSDEYEAISDGSGKACRQEADATVNTFSQHIDGDVGSEEYEQLKPLCRSCAVEELLGVFRLPIGGHFSPCCVRKNTDPPQERQEDLIILGHDMEISDGSSGRPLGISFDQMNKHLFVTAVPGNGKTTTMINILLQFRGYRWCGEDTGLSLGIQDMAGLLGSSQTKD